jgi:hypothetical protein
MDSSTEHQKYTLIVGMIVVSLGLVVCVILVLTLVVFTNDTNKAKDLIGRAMPHMALVQQDIQVLSSEIDALIDMIPRMGPEAEFQAATAGIRQQVLSMNSELKQAETAYSQIAGLAGLQDYKEYAKVALSLVRNDQTMTAQVNYYLDDILAAIRQGGTGRDIDPLTFNTRSSEFITMFNGLRGDATTLKEKAEKMRGALSE